MAGSQDSKHVICSVSMLSGLSKRFNSPELSDVTLEIEGKQYYAHKLLLIQSPVFHSLLLNKRWKDSRKRKVVLQEDRECLVAVEDFLQFFYSGSASLNRDTVIPLMMLANKYEVLDLERECQIYVGELVFMGTNISAVLEWWKLAKALALYSLETECLKYIKYNFAKVVTCNAFTNLSLDELQELFSDINSLVLSSEFQVFKAIDQWLQKNSDSRADFETKALALVPYLKVWMIPVGNFSSVEETISEWPITVMEKVQNMLNVAYRFNTLSLSERKEANLDYLQDVGIYTKSSLCGSLVIPMSYVTNTSTHHVCTKELSFPASTARADLTAMEKWRVNYSRSSRGFTVSFRRQDAEKYPDGADTGEMLMLISKTRNSITFLSEILTVQLKKNDSSKRYEFLIPKSVLRAASPHASVYQGETVFKIPMVVKYKFLSNAEVRR